MAGTPPQDLVEAVASLIKAELYPSDSRPGSQDAGSVQNDGFLTDLVCCVETAIASLKTQLHPDALLAKFMVALSKGVRMWWEGVAALPNLPSIPEMARSKTLEVLSAIVASAGYFPTQFHRLVDTWEDQSIFKLTVAEVGRKEQRRGMVELVEWFGYEICEKQWKMDNVWKCRGKSSALSYCVAQGDHALLRIAKADRLDIEDWQSALGLAISKPTVGVETVSALLDVGLDHFKPFGEEKTLIPSLVLLVQPDDPESQYDKLRAVLERSPESVNTVWKDASSAKGVRLLPEATVAGRPRLISLLLSFNVPFSVRFEALSAALLMDPPNYDVVAALLEGHDGPQSWVKRYDELSLRILAELLARLAISSFPPNESYNGSDKYSYSPEKLRTLQLVLRKGFQWPWAPYKRNALLCRLFLCGSSPEPSRESLPISEADALALLRLYRAHGLNIMTLEEGEDPSDHPVTLLFLACRTAVLPVVEMCLDELGCDVNDYWDRKEYGERLRLLSFAFQRPWRRGVADFLIQRGASTFFSETLEDYEQPVSVLLEGGYGDDEALPFLVDIVERHPDILEWPGWHKVGGDDLLGLCCRVRSTRAPKLKCFEYLLRKKLPGTMELIRHHTINVCADGCPAERSLPAFLANSWNWQGLTILLENCELQVTEPIWKGRTVEELVLEVGEEGSKAPPASLVDLVKAKAAREREAHPQTPNEGEAKPTEADSEEISDPFHRAVSQGNTALIRRWVSRRGLDLAKNTDNVASEALCLAFRNGLVDTFELLVRLGASVLYPYTLTIPFYAVAVDSTMQQPKPEIKASNIAMVKVMAKRPEVINHKFLHGEDSCWDMLSWAIKRCEGDPSIVKVLLEAGFPLRYQSDEIVVHGRRMEMESTLETALKVGSPSVLETVVEFGVLTEWRSRYSEETKFSIGGSLVYAAVCSFPTLSFYRGLMQNKSSPDTNKQIFDLLTRSGFDHVWAKDGENLLLVLLFGPVTKNTGLPISQAHVVDLLRMWKSAGLSLECRGVTDEKPWLLQHHAASCDLPLVLDLALTELGADVEATCGKEHAPGTKWWRRTTLSVAFDYEQGKAAAGLLLDKYKARVLCPHLHAIEQPLIALLVNPYSDLDSLGFLKMMVQREPRILEWEGWRAPEAFHPLMACLVGKKKKCLGFLLQTCTSSAVGLALKPCRMTSRAENGAAASTLVDCGAYCVIHTQWEYLAVLLEYGAVNLTETRLLHMLTAHATSARGPEAPPRSILAALKAQVVKEREEKKQGATKAKGKQAPVVASNAFDLPAAKVLTERDEKKKAKKAAAKKKAKAKKREAAKAANAGAGSAKAAADDSDSSGTEDESDEEVEPGTEHLVDSRNAPDLTVMLAARKAARAKEDAEAAAAAEAERARSEKRKEE
jgi:hypothetical protein